MMQRPQPNDPWGDRIKVGDDTTSYSPRMGAAQSNERNSPTSRSSGDGGYGVFALRENGAHIPISGQNQCLSRLEYTHAITVFIRGQVCPESIDGIERSSAYVVKGAPVEGNEVPRLRAFEKLQRV